MGSIPTPGTTLLAAALCLLAGCGGPTAPPVSTPSAIVDVPAGITGSNGYPGQSFTLATGQRVNHLQFTWYRRTGDVSAAGTLYLLTQEFLGQPGALSPQTFGYLSHSARVEGNRFIFPDAVTLSAGLTYWVYSDTQQDYSLVRQHDRYPGGAMYNTGHGSQPFRHVPAEDISFRLEGVPVR